MTDRIKQRRGLRRSGLWSVLVALVMGLQVVAALPAGAISTGILISEVRTKGSNEGGDEFVELFNASTAAIDISGWKLNRSSSNGNTNLLATVPAATSIGAGCHYLLANTDYDDAVPEDHAWGDAGIAHGGGVAVLTTLDVVIDEIGFGAGSAYQEGTPLAPLAATVDESYGREPGGASGHATDTDDNSADFSLLQPSDPENAASPCHTSGISSPQTLGVSVVGNGTGTVTSDPAGIDCGTDCEEDYDQGTLVTLTAAPETDSWFEGWSAPCTDTFALTCAVTMSEARAVTARFSLPTFADVPLDHRFFFAIEAIYDAGVTSGCTFDAETGIRNYCPANNNTRGQMAKFLMVADGQTELVSATPTFSDVSSGHTFYGWIERAFEQGVTSGCFVDAGTGEQRYCPQANVTRGQMAKLLLSTVGQTELASATPTFSDVPADHLFYGWIERAFEQGVTSGCSLDEVTGERRYCPSDPITRGQMARFLAQAFDLSPTG